jgi:hypothetical protein
MLYDIRSADLAAKGGDPFKDGPNTLSDELTMYAGHAGSNEAFCEAFALVTDPRYKREGWSKKIQPLLDFVEATVTGKKALAKLPPTRANMTKPLAPTERLTKLEVPMDHGDIREPVEKLVRFLVPIEKGDAPPQRVTLRVVLETRQRGSAGRCIIDG